MHAMTKFSVPLELPHAAGATPPGVAASLVEALHGPWMPRARDDPSETSRDGQAGQHLRLITMAPPAKVSEPHADVAPEACFFICHTPRCGSTLLCDALSATGVAGYPEEYFPERARDGTAFVATGAALKDPDTWRLDWTNNSFEECLDSVLRSGTTPNSVFASKLKWPNMPYLDEMLDALPQRGDPPLAKHLESLFPNLRYVWVTRRNKLRQAVSLIKARQSAQWKAMSAQANGSGAADYSFYLVDTALRQIVREECAWERFFTHAGIVPFTVVYEDLVHDYEPTVRRLLDHLEIGLPKEYLFPAPRLHKQADAASEDWVERYQRDARASRMWRGFANLPVLTVRRRLRETYVLPRLGTQISRVWARHKRTSRRSP